MTTRRKLLQALGASLTLWPLVGGAQPARKVHRIGILNIGMTADYIGPQPKNSIVNEFLRRLRELGYVYGENFVTEGHVWESFRTASAAHASVLNSEKASPPGQPLLPQPR